MFLIISFSMLTILIKLILVTANPELEAAYKPCVGRDAKESPLAYFCGPVLHFQETEKVCNYF